MNATIPGLPPAITLTPTATFGGLIFDGGFIPDILKSRKKVFCFNEELWREKMRTALEAIKKSRDNPDSPACSNYMVGNLHGVGGLIGPKLEATTGL